MLNTDFEGVGAQTSRKDNTAEERRKALRFLTGQAETAGTWHPPLLTIPQTVEQMMDMLGIKPEWLS